MKSFWIFFLIFFNSIVSFSQILTEEETKLFNLIMEYRKERGLSSIPVSRSLTYVAQTHARDLEENSPDQGKCNMHSWSSNGPWTACCYTKDHAKASCMWDKPRELTTYTGNGYEIAFWTSGTANAKEALDSWKISPGHNEVIISSGMWKRSPWQAIGIGICGGYSVVWFGKDVDK